MHCPLPASRSRPRACVERGVVLLLIIVTLRTWYLEGLLVPCQVTSGSMAATLLGLHREVICVDCGHRFACEADLPQVSPRAVCPNCGYAENDLASQPNLSGDRILIHKAVFRMRPVRRWEVVAFRRPQEMNRVYVKRVLGLPNESIQIRQGDVYVGGHVPQKTLAQQRAMAILVHDASRQPILDPVPPPRWRGEGSDTQWGSADGRFAHPSTSDKGPIDWLVYHHWERQPGRKGEVRPARIADVCGYNQTRPRRAEDFHAVRDLMLCLRLIETWGQGRLIVRISDGPERFEVRIHSPQNRYEVVRNGRPVPGAAGRLPVWSEGLLVEVSVFDKQFLLALDGQSVVERAYDYDPAAPRPRADEQPLAIGSQGLGVSIRDLKVYRDVYYSEPAGSGRHWGIDEPYQLGENEYFVLGDNSPVSLDSRNWPEQPGVDGSLLVGKPLLVHFPARRVEIGRWVFQVPDLTRIRYIR